MEVDFVKIAATVVALCSFVLSIYIITRDRKNRRNDNLYKCRQRLLEVHHSEKQYIPDELISFEEDPDSEETQKYYTESRRNSHLVDIELEFACYMVLTKQVDRKEFWDLFRTWLKSRYLIWQDGTHFHYKKINYPYTWKLIKEYERKGYLDPKDADAVRKKAASKVNSKESDH